MTALELASVPLVRELNGPVDNPRMHFIGGSDVAAIMGLNHYPGGDRETLKRRKLGLQPEDENIFMDVGKALEPIVLAEYERNQKCKLAPKEIVVHPDWTWARGELDGTVVENRIVVDAKTTGFPPKAPAKGKEWSPHSWGLEPNQVPASVVAQVSWYMWLKDWQLAHLALLVKATCKLRVYVVERDRWFEQRMLSQVKQFWDEVQYERELIHANGQ